MATVRLLVAMSGAEQSWPTGAVYECDDASAARLVAAGRATWLVPSPPAAETTMTAGAPERAVKPRGKAR